MDQCLIVRLNLFDVVGHIIGPTTFTGASPFMTSIPADGTHTLLVSPTTTGGCVLAFKRSFIF